MFANNNTTNNENKPTGTNMFGNNATKPSGGSMFNNTSGGNKPAEPAKPTTGGKFSFLPNSLTIKFEAILTSFFDLIHPNHV